MGSNTQSSTGTVETHYGACNLCEAICGLEFQIQDGEILSIKGDKNDPLSRGHICPKAVALKDIYKDPDRLRKPVRRIREENGDRWEEIDWETAFDEVTDRLATIHEQQGNNAIGVYQGNPNVHNYGSMTHSSQFLGPLRTKSRFSATSVDQLPHQLVGMWMFGHQLLVPITDIDRCNFFLVLGANPMASNGSLMTVPDFRHRLKALQDRGGKMIVIDPRRSETADIADEHHFIRPGSDAAFLAALLNTLYQEDLIDPKHLAGFTDGLDEVGEAIREFTPERAADITGIPAEEIRRIAREFAAADGAACYGRMGVSTQAYGGLCQWLIQLINVGTGNLDRPGGVLFTKPAVDLVGGVSSKPGHYNVWQSRVSKLPEFSGELPASTMTEEIMTPGDGRIRAMITIAGNPVLSTPNGKQLEVALGQLDFMVSVDMYINETTRHADLILPPTSALEHDHYDLIFHIFAVHNTAKYSPALFDKPKGTMHDWEIFNGLGERLSKRLGSKWKMSGAPHKIVDLGLRIGPYGMRSKHWLSINKLKKNPHGIDLGPLKPSLPGRLQHKNKRIRCAIPELMADLQRLEQELFSAPASQGLRLIGRRHVRSNNSWMHNYQRLVKGKDRCLLLMHPDDMQAQGFTDLQTVELNSRVGSVRATVQGTDEMMPGVVSLPHGWGHSRKGTRMKIAEEHAGVSVNDITDDRFFDPLSGNAAVNGVPVTVSAVNNT